MLASLTFSFIFNLLQENDTPCAWFPRELKNSGIDIIGLSLGEPDFNVPDFIKNAAISSINQNYNSYSPVDGYDAFWLYDPLEESVKYREGEYSEEIDIFEVFGKANKKENQRAYYAAVHRYQTPYVESLVNKKKYKLENRYTRLEVPYDFYQDFHIYGLLWTPDELIWYLDGEEVFRRVNDFFKRPLHVIFDAEIMETWDGLPNPDDLPSTFEVDYVRVWRLKK